MNILLLGSGGREHAIARALSFSHSLDKLYCYPGNPGIYDIAEKTDIEKLDFQEITEFCLSHNITLVVVGPEKPLADGISNILTQNGIKVFGPTKQAARLESSKGFAKEFMARHNIPTAKYKIFSAKDEKSAYEYLKNCKFPVVLKADGLAAGKGVIIANDFQSARVSLDSMFKGMFAEAGKTVVIEEFLQGREASILAICDGKDYITLPSSQDHKRALDGDLGKNTGGMGAYSPAPIVTESVMDKVNEKILKPAIEGLRVEGFPFVGCLYAGLMIDNDEPEVVEFNVRFGDPETQAVLSLFEGDLAKLLYSAACGSLDKSAIKEMKGKHACCVIIASEGYPDEYKKGFEITGIEDAEKTGAIVYQSGTKLQEEKLLGDGGRVLGVTCVSTTLKTAIEQAYDAIKKINFSNMFYRKDIGKKAL
ncbi:MAG: phosphoribosylamine--glycine ligase [Ignavibacteria bacterium GWB2_35_12]|nr:MAG: phosphoribosylamine--glycine ligase [Ignavibacteria bacterium GWB2_35_12]OGU88817.1 MAG: phosphoribosylamine--glycine ligase [Ignavibacteria bacterium RIFOXYA2_FULL_35_10]OGV20896.1 MAG: phosphoribosylamine--glycine ligase [Ignavibacteria bacterium RIFOXYC2_FULL_35_21]